MPPVVKMGDSTELVPTSKFAYAKFPFEFFNPLQSRVFDYHDKDNSCIIAAATSAGKTIAAEMFLAHTIRVKKQKGMYLAPLRALASEKIGDWQEKIHHFSDLNLSICTGDYRLTAKRKKELEAADLVIMTSEMLNSRCRNFNEEKNGWLKDIGVLVVDECLPPSAKIETNLGPISIGQIVDQNLDVKVASYNHHANKVEFRKIVARQKKLLKRRWLTLYYQGGEVSVTENHLVWCENRGYIPSKLLEEGDIIYVRVNKEGATSNSRNIAGGWLTSKVATREVSTTSSSTVGEATGISGVEIQRIEKIGWNSTKGCAKHGVRERTLSFRHSFTCLSSRNQASLLSRREETDYNRLVNANNRPCSIGSMVYGRRKPGKEPNGNTHRRVQSTRSGDACKLDGTLVGCPLSCVSNQNILATSFYFFGEGCIPRQNQRRSNTRVLLQNSYPDGENILFDVCKAIPSRPSQHKDRKESFALWGGRMPSEVEQDVRADEDLDGEESWCCDLEVEADSFEECNFFADGVLVHNSHLLTVPGRGDHLEAGLMKFTEFNPHCRIVFLSATMPNVDEISDWVSYILTHRDTCLISSTYRPCPLNVHYEKYWDGERSYEDNELQKISLAMQIVDYYPDDKFLIFVHTKKTGELMKLALQRAKIKCEYHNADLDKAKRTQVEKDFKSDSSLRVIVATSTLAWGLNLPARRVIVLGVHRGLNEVATYDVAQMVGRAGRPSYDPVGDAYVLLPENTFDMHKARLKKPQRIESQMLDQMGGRHKVLAFHLVSEIHQGNIQSKDDVHHWYKRSLACFQTNELDEQVVEDTIELLRKIGAIWEEEGKLTVTSVGKVASIFYYSPFDVADMKRNFTQLFASGRQEDDYCLSFALGNIDTLRCGIVSKAEREEMAQYTAKINFLFPEGYIAEPAIKAGYAYHTLLSGHPNPVLAGFSRGLQFDFPRTNQVLQAIDSFTGKWGKKGWLHHLMLRMAYGVRGPQAYLCQLPHVGKARANKLYHAGVKTIQDVADNPNLASSLLGLKSEMMDEIISEAKRLSFLKSADLA